MARLNTKIALRSDTTAGWASADTAAKDAGGQGVVLLKGEVGVEFITNSTPKMKIGDGITAWPDLEYVGGAQTNVLEVIPQENETAAQALARESQGKVFNNGDIAYVKETIFKHETDSTQDKYSYTAYVYKNGAWAAMDGNYSANNIYFDDNMMVTKDIGYITVNSSTGAGTIPSAGKNLVQVFEEMFVKESQPTVTDPSVSLTAAKNTAYEVGEKVTPTYSVSLNAGSYTYGPATGVTERATEDTTTGWKITATGVTGFKTEKTGSYPEITVSDNTNFTIKAVVAHTAGATPLTNKGNVSTKSPIAEGTKEKTSAAITGYRKFFYGGVTKDVTELTSADIRGLTDGGKYTGQKLTIKANGRDNLKAFVIAVPNSTNCSITKVVSTAGMTVEMPTSSYALSTTLVDVADKRGGTVTKSGDTYTSDNNPMPYKLFVWKPDAIGSGVIHEVTVG